MPMKRNTLAALPIFFLLTCFIQAQTVHAQTVTSFEGIDAIDVADPTYDIDANGAVGTKQYMEWVNSYYQAFSKTSPYTPVWDTPQDGDTPWENAGMSNCYGTGGGEGTITFDRITSVWVIARPA